MRLETAREPVPWFLSVAVHPHYTGGQYSIVRVGLAVFTGLQLLKWLFASSLLFSNQGLLGDGRPGFVAWLFPNILAYFDSAQFVHALILFAMGLCVLLAIGLYDRFAAVVLWYIIACLHGRNPITPEIGLLLMGWALLAHALTPGEPYGSLAARGRVDPGGGWVMPRIVHNACWFMLALTYACVGIAKLNSETWMSGTVLIGTLRSGGMYPVWLRDAAIAAPDSAFVIIARVTAFAEIAFAPLALWSRARPIIWAWTLILHQAFLASVVFHSLEPGLLMLHLLCFDPGWIRPRGSGPVETIRYDGNCGLCHRLVRFIIAEDGSVPGSKPAFRFAPLPAAADARSMIVETADGRKLTHAAAVLHVLRRLGGLWVVMADLLAIVPAPILNLLYRGVADLRHTFFRRPPDLCPVLPPHLRDRFDLP